MSDASQHGPSQRERAAAATLNRLIVACNDDARAQTSASLVVFGERRAWLERSATRRGVYVDELRELIVRYGGEPTAGVSAVESFREALHRVNAFIIGPNAGDAHANCARIEEKTEKLYGGAAVRDLPSSATPVIDRHRAQISSDRAELRRLSAGG